LPRKAKLKGNVALSRIRDSGPLEGNDAEGRKKYYGPDKVWGEREKKGGLDLGSSFQLTEVRILEVKKALKNFRPWQVQITPTQLRCTGECGKREELGRGIERIVLVTLANGG